MSDKNFIKNITSKDIGLSQETIKTLIEDTNIENFKELTKASEFIFPFIKQRIVKDFVTLVNEYDLGTVFEFSKIYSSDFEDLIVDSWVKFACEDLTDEILELFETGTVEQKAYCAKYFSRIQDSLALEFLNKNAKSDFAPLKINCAQALCAFKDKAALNQMMTLVLESKDEFEKTSAYEFINAYGGENSIKFTVRNALKSPFVSTIITNLLDYSDFETLKKTLNSDEIINIFNVLLDSYPENTSLDTILYYEVYQYLRFIQTSKTQYATNTLFLAKTKFEEFQTNEIYSYDLDKNTKQELKRICAYLESLELSPQKMEREIEEAKNKYLRFDCALEVIKEYKLVQFAPNLSTLVNSRELTPQYLAKTIEVLKELKKTDSIQRRVIEEITDPNIKALVESYIN